jgi:hypothetical protein
MLKDSIVLLLDVHIFLCCGCGFGACCLHGLCFCLCEWFFACRDFGSERLNFNCLPRFRLPRNSPGGGRRGACGVQSWSWLVSRQEEVQ